MAPLLADLRAAGFQVEIIPPDALRIAPCDRLTDEWRARVRRNKPALVAALRREQYPTPPPVIPETADDQTHDRPRLMIGDLLHILDGDPTVATANQRLAEFLARPGLARVRCGECLHFIRDRVGDGSGIGGCSVNAPSTGLRWPNAARYCPAFAARLSEPLRDQLMSGKR